MLFRVNERFNQPAVWEFENQIAPIECQIWQFSPGLSHCPGSKDMTSKEFTAVLSCLKFKCDTGDIITMENNF